MKTDLYLTIVNLLSDVIPKAVLPVEPHDEPQLQRSEPTTERNVPVTVVRNLTLKFQKQKTFFILR
jgi:hypothetical protein